MSAETKIVPNKQQIKHRLMLPKTKDNYKSTNGDSKFSGGDGLEFLPSLHFILNDFIQ